LLRSSRGTDQAVEQAQSSIIVVVVKFFAVSVLDSFWNLEFLDSEL
jgi:hypothetical protein